MPHSRLSSRLFTGLLTLGLCLLWAACEPRNGAPLGSELDEPDYRLGQRLVKQGRSPEALAAYLRVIEKRGDAAPESHLEAGIICLQQIKDPIAAIYHFRKYLERQPNSPQASQVRGLVESAKREFARTLPANPLENQSERLDMVEQISRLQRENDQLKAELAMARGNAVQPAVNQMRVPTGGGYGFATATPPDDVSPISVAPEVRDEAPALRETAPPTRPQPTAQPGGRRHVVVKGDTLFSLAQRYYNDRSRWRDIYNANRDVMPNENSLSIGMNLSIP
ncbi:MAG: LysM peptidoglycan-binding domain-containing protein [Opitutaceae bacterium]|nr:LysM peptidoglycan-binding domain-containing protein [Cephaloticoccus sp.]MCP5529696.1 LysM peptidoglycan-binding domain-containing protein [Opitutaceae bacterium]